MAFEVLLERQKTLFPILVLLAGLACKGTCETGDCGQQEFRDRSGNCVLCKQCGPGMELSKECGFGFGEDARCASCRPLRFKEDWGFQQCKPCLDCALLSRLQKANCSATADAVCGDCLPGFYRKTMLVGFQDVECVPCGDPPPPYEPHCSSKVNLVRIPSTASSPRDTALAAVICSALATVLLALLTLCVIYCKRQFMEKKPSWSLRTQDPRYQGSELSCFDRPRLSTSAPRVCCQCHRDSPATCGPVHLTASGCCDGVCIVGRETPGCRVHSKAAHQERSVCGEFSDAWPLMQNPSCGDDISSCDSYAGLTGEDVPSLSLEDGSPSSLDPSGRRGLVGEAAPIPAHLEDLTETTDLPRHSNSLPEPVLTQDVLSARSQRGQEREDPLICPPTHPTRCSSDGLQWAQR
ncbi:tumor necrosis factor receptor superfamily member 19 isoform X2 [Camelus ferus]|uniref:Tumor necrosis factor receptor superfamily member 19 isoform X2 n=2 Tax=Camelus TaxID=9836 RepID=A0A8B7K4W8_CAMFR|nr:tumor necrosis factor receptor superfamily member 19 isoform X2 [Camelus ferus]